MPTKSRPYVYRVVHSTNNYSGPNPNGQSLSVTNNVLSGTNTRTDGGSVPGYRQRIAQGIDATSSLSGTKYTVAISNGSLEHTWFRSSDRNYIRYARTGNITNPAIPGSTGFAVTVADNQAISSFISAARQVQTSIQGGTVLGELRETLQMIRRPAMALRKGLSDYLVTLRKRRRGSAKHRARVAAGTWLEYSFGWTPLIRDIDAAAKALATDYSLRREIVPVRGFGRDDRLLTSSSNEFQDIGTLKWMIHIRKTETVYVIYRGGVLCEVDNPLLMRAQNFGFMPKDFVPTLWELIPYSFLVDYFTNIGDILSCWSFGSSNFSWKNRTEVRSTKELRTTTPGSKPFLGGGYELKVNHLASGSSEAEVRTVQRSRHEGALIPSLGFQIPGVGSRRWINLSALAAQHRRLVPY